MKKQTRMWKCKDRSKIRICDMTNSHLLSSIAMLERFSRHIHSQRLSACASIVFQGEMAQDAQDDFIANSESNDFLPPIYKNLILEKLRRGI